ncbi:universal stress protein [Gynuella sunshinyii]|uniref:Universal stress protein UspA and related nucleotide-binding protein n=1 Tax=Gynuella sunshinyii YC6258 TaxID=1445510 RepID=A0A0C5VSJ7_9GAMM|nr:universal stress protein [Gynuella sunshinyii]AJQ97662.1 universal stress protein UspA and related nucleotide-binding protein [Gynuella sunshinyii YC6258]
MSQPVLYATDLENGSDVVFRIALQQAMLSDARIYFLHVFEETFRKDEDAFGGGYQIKSAQQKHIDALLLELQELMQQRIQHILEHELKDQPFDQERIEVLVSFGSASQKIVEVAKNKDVSMIIMGDRRVNALSRFFLGSTAQRVIHNAGVPVLIVPISKKLSKHQQKAMKDE